MFWKLGLKKEQIIGLIVEFSVIVNKEKFKSYIGDNIFIVFLLVIVELMLVKYNIGV